MLIPTHIPTPVANSCLLGYHSVHSSQVKLAVLSYLLSNTETMTMQGRLLEDLFMTTVMRLDLSTKNTSIKFVHMRRLSEATT